MIVLGTLQWWIGNNNTVFLLPKKTNIPVLNIILIHLHYVMTVNKQWTYIRLVPFQWLLCIFVKLTQSYKHHRLYQLWRKLPILLRFIYLQVLLAVESYCVAVFYYVRWVVVHYVKDADVKYLVKLEYCSDCFLLWLCRWILFIVLFVHQAWEGKAPQCVCTIRRFLLFILKAEFL